MDYNELKIKMNETKSEMKPNERLEKYFEEKEVDHIPFNFLSVTEALCEVYGYKTSEMHSDFEIYAEIIERGINDSYIDRINIRLGLQTLGAAMGSTLHCPEHGIDNIEKHILQDYNDWDKTIDPDPYDNSILTPMLEKAIKLKERFPKATVSTGTVGPFSTAISIRPIEKVLKDTKKDPEKLKELLMFCVDNSLRWVEIFTKEVGAAQASLSDPVTCTDILSKKQFEEFSLPELKRLVSGLKKITGTKPALHICGHTKGLWPYLKRLEISSFSVDNCEDLAETCEALGDTFIIVGNVPPVDILRNGSIDDVIKGVKDCIAKGSTSPKGYILSSGCQVPIGTPKKNLDAYLYAVRKYGQGAKIGELPRGMNSEKSVI